MNTSATSEYSLEFGDKKGEMAIKYFIVKLLRHTLPQSALSTKVAFCCRDWKPTWTSKYYPQLNSLAGYASFS